MAREDRAVSVADDPDYLHEYDHLTLVRLLLAQHRTVEVRSTAAPDLPADVLRLLDQLHAAAESAERHGSVREIRMLQALAHHASGDCPRAIAALGRSLVDPPEPDSYVRLYLDEGSAMRRLLQDAAEREGAEPTVQDRARWLLEHAAALEPDAAEPEAALSGPLSPREREVLRLLDSELSGPEIARRLYVTLNTLRTHTKRIYTKLDVTTRAAAVRRAHEWGSAVAASLRPHLRAQ